MVNTGSARRVTSINSKKIQLAANEKYGEKDETIALASDTLFIVGGQQAQVGNIYKNDTIVVVTDDTYKAESGYPTNRHVRAVVKLSLPFSAYDQKAYQSLTQLVPCGGNAGEKCKTGYAASIDVYSASINSTKIGEYRTLNGVITSLSPSQIVIQGTSGAQYSVQTTTDIVGEFNSQKSADYDGKTINVGDSIEVSYFADSATNKTRVISQKNIESISLALEVVSKGDSINKY